MADLFASKVAVYGSRLMDDLDLEDFQAAGVFGNVGHECGGFKLLQEIQPMVAGSKGGYGWMQWTGPRRRAYEAWCKADGLDPASDEANYNYLVAETTGAEKASLAALRNTTALAEATEVFCRKNLRPGVLALPARQKWAAKALAAMGSAPVAVVSAQRVTTVEPAGKAPGLLALVAGKLGFGPKHVGVPAVVGSVGDPTIFYVQKTLREKAYYTKGFLDGLDGGITQSAVAQARKDNGLGDGGIDAAFLTALPGMPQRPVSVARSNVTLAQAADHAPELFSAPSWMWKAGLGVMGLGGADGARQTGLLDGLKDGVGKANDVFGSVQTAIGYLASGVSFVVEHRILILLAVGALLVWKAVSAMLSAWIKVRQAFF